MTTALQAQIVETGTITGLVRDNTGAVVDKAHVTVRSAGTGLTTNTATDSQGIYVSPPLAPGEYTVEIEALGFSKAVQHIRLEVGQRAAADAVLAVGQATDTIDVASSGSLLETESSSVSNLRTEEEVRDLPLNGRNFAELLGLGAGVVPGQSQLAGSIPYAQQRGPTSYAVNGLRMTENRFLLDGIGDNENHNGLGVVIFPPVDAVEEFSEETTDADARYGRGAGGTINAIYKSGTNQYHGEVFEFLRNSALDTKNYFDTGAKPGFRMNEFGATFGGPLFSKKDPKTFFFADYAGQRTSQGLTNINTVPDFTVNSVGYDFSAYSQKIKNPATGTFFAGNVIPFSALTTPQVQVGEKILALYQKYATPNRPGYTTANNFLYNPPRIINEDAFDVKVDHRFSDADNAFIRYSQSQDNILQPGILPAPLVGANVSGPASQPAHQAVLSETHIFSPATINTVRFGWSRIFITAQNFNAGKNLPTQLGIPGVEVPGDPLSDGLPVLKFTGYTSLGDAANSPTQIGTNNYQLDDSVNLVRGKHSLDIGAELVRLQYNMYQTGAEHGSMTFSGSYTGLPFADLLFGAPKSGTYQYQKGTRGFRQTDLAFYAQDNWKATSRLTLNLGVRYENFLGWPWTEVNNRMYQFDPALSTTQVFQVGTHGIPRSGVSGNNFNFMPRVGLAYRVTPKTVFRAGYGIYYAAPNVANSSGLSMNAPALDYWAFNNTTYGAAQASGAPFNYVSNGFVHTPATSASALPSGLPLSAVDPHAKTPYSEQWHASIQQQITPTTTITAAYVGNVGVHLDGLVDINQGSPGTTNVTVGRPYPFFNQIYQLQTSLVSNYNALQITAERRAGNLSFLASYTYSHALDENSGSPGSIVNSYNKHADYGNSDQNIPNRFVASVNYKLPFHASGKLRPVVQGWHVNAILNFYDGLPFSVTSRAIGDGITERAQLTGARTPGFKSTLSQWVDPAAFAAPAAGTWGNSGRNILRGPGTKDVDFSVFKNFTLAESKSLEVRGEFFNLFNTPLFNNPTNLTVGGAGFGSISSAGSPTTLQRTSREIQLAAKLYF
jgi:outer membrane receptor protein involved in Fe transport